VCSHLFELWSDAANASVPDIVLERLAQMVETCERRAHEVRTHGARRVGLRSHRGLHPHQFA
jgi:hypothetical protein